MTAEDWTGSAGDNQWFTPGNWSGGAVPTYDDRVGIYNGAVVIASGEATAWDLTLGPAVGNAVTLTIAQGASLTLQDGDDGAYGDLDVGQDLDGYGGIAILNVAGGRLESGELWVNSKSGAVGDQISTLDITAGGTVISLGNSFSLLGGNKGWLGKVRISDAGSLWRTSTGVVVGQAGSGQLIVENGGRMEATGTDDIGIVFGDHPGGEGIGIIRGAGSTVSVPAGIDIGKSGTGTLSILEGGTLESGAGGVIQWGAGIAVNPGSSGKVIVDGDGSSWVNTAGIYIGVFGQGTLTISNGGQVSNQLVSGIAPLFGGYDTPGDGTVLVTGQGSLWKTAGLQMAERTDSTARLTVVDGGALAITDESGISVGIAGDAEINIGAAAGAAPAVPGTITSPTIDLLQPEKSRIVFNHTDNSGNYTLDTVFTGQGDISVLAGATTLPSESPDFAGRVSIAGGRLAINGRFGGDFTIASAGTLAGSSSIGGDVDNAGTIDISGRPDGSAGVPGQVLTIRGNYTSGSFADGSSGTLILDTVLGDNGSVTDRLVIDSGIASGDTLVRVRNTGGLGAQTTGDGILVIEAVNAATTADATFSLGSNRVAAGLYEYSLHRGGDLTDNWYLSSQQMPEPPAPPEPPPEPEPPAPVLPNYRVEVPVYMVAPALANRLGLAMLGTYHDRAGEHYTLPLAPVYEERLVYGKDGRKQAVRVPAQQPADSSKFFTGGWARLFGETGSVGYGGKDAASRLAKFEKHGPSYDYDLAGFQAGLDVYRKDMADGGSYTAGLYVGSGRIDSDVKGVYGGKAGSLAMDAYSVGAYATRKGASGWYLDGVLQGTLFRDIEGTSVGGERMDSDGWGFTASLEGGYPVALGGGFTLEPQAQVIYQHISLDSGSDRFGYVHYDDTDAVYGRIGARLAKNWTLAGNHTLTTWVRANLWHTFGADAKTTFSNVYDLNPGTLSTSLGGTWAQLGVGISGQVNENVSLFASGDYNLAVGNGNGHSLSGRLGIKVVW